MKRNNIINAIATLVVMIVCTNGLLAQATATASASATVVAPIAMSKNVNMNFGNAAVSVSSGGSVILAPVGTRTTAGSGVTLPATAGTVSAANFTISGAPGYTFAITLPSTATIAGPGAATMTVSSFTSSPSATGTLSGSGTQTLTVGATLAVNPAQAAGTYTNASAVPVTVNYN